MFPVSSFAGIVDISDLNKKALLIRLYASAAPRGLGRLQYKQGALSDADAESVLKGEGGRIDYLYGRSMKIDLSGKELDTSLYNRDNGDGVAEGVIASLRDHK